MFASLLRSARRWWSPRRPHPIRRSQTPRRRLGFELLEDRVVPTTSTMAFAGLEFSTTGTFTVNNHLVTSSDPVQVGVAPKPGSVFTPVLQLDAGVSYMDNDTTGMFTTTGTVSGLAGGDTDQLLDAQKHTFTAPGLLGTSYFTLPSTDTNMPHLTVGGGQLQVTALHLAATELDLQGTIDISKVSGLTVAVQGTDHVVLNANGLSIAGPDPTVTGPDTFTRDGVTLAVANLDVHVDPITNALDISGTGSVTIGGNLLTLALGNTSTPGLVIQNGDIESLLATITPSKGNTNTQFTFDKLQLALTSATLSFNQASGEFGIGADATVTLDGHSADIKIGAPGSPGIVVNTSGQLASLDALLTTDIDIGSVTFHAEDLGIHYVPGQDLAISGMASFMFNNQKTGTESSSTNLQKIEVALGSTDSNGTLHPGIDIDPATGNIKSLDAAVSTDLEIGGLTIQADDLGIHYAPGADFTITGKAEFDLQDDKASAADAQEQMLTIMLGQDGHPGIDIDPSGKLVSLDAAVTTDITIAGLHIKTDGLGIDYQASDNSIAIYGSASFALMDNSVSVALGTADKPGLVIDNGQLTSLTASVTADISVLGIKLSANGLTVAYTAPKNGNAEMIDIYGDVAVTTSFLTFDSNLGSANAPGLEIVGGQLTQLNITVNGGFSLFGLNVAANDLSIRYNQPLSSLELSGGLMIQFTDSFQASASITKGGLLINTQTGALSIDDTNGLALQASATFGSYGVPNLLIDFSNGTGGINFSAMGELDLPDNIKVVLDKLDIVNGQLADVGLTLDAPIPIGDTGFYLDTLSGELDNLNNPSQLTVSAGATISFGQKLPIPSIPGIFSAPADGVYLADASGNITISPSELKLTGSVDLLGGLLGQGQASIDLNWATGIYSVSGSFGMFDNIITFSGSLVITSQGDITLQAMASVNVPPQVPFIGGDSLGNINFALKYIHGDWTDSYIAAWTSVNLFVTSFTFGFKVDFTGQFSFLGAGDVQAIAQATAAPAPPQLYYYTQPVTISDPNATGAEITLNSSQFFGYGYSTNNVTESITGFGGGGSGNTVFTYYNLNNTNVILPSLSLELYDDMGNGPVDVGTITFDQAGNFQFKSTNKTSIVPTGATFGSGLLTLQWQGTGTPGQTSVSGNFYTSGDYIELLQNIAPGGSDYVPVDRYEIDPQSVGGGGYPSAGTGDAIHSDQATSTTPTKLGGGQYLSTYMLDAGFPKTGTFQFSVYSSDNTLIGTGTVGQFNKLTFTPNGNQPMVPIGAFINDATFQLTWPGNPGSTHVTAMYQSVNDRTINVNFQNDIATGGQTGQYEIELVSTTPWDTPPMVYAAPEYATPTVAFAGGSPTLTASGVLTGTLLAQAYTPTAQMPGATTISLYYSTQDNTTDGTAIATYNYTDFTSGGSGNPRSLNFTWDGFQNLKPGQYYVWAVINDGQNQQQVSQISGPFTAVSQTPTLAAPSFLALTPNTAGVEQGVFSAANNNALGVMTPFVNPVTIEIKVNGGGTVTAAGGSATADFTQTYDNAADATRALDGLTFTADSTFDNFTTITYSATTNINGTMYSASQTIPLLTPNTHLVVSQTVSGTVNGITLTNAGGGYQSAPTVTFTSADGKGGGATGIATINNQGQVTGVTIVNHGSGYDMPPLVSFTGGAPMTPATATATIIAPPADPDSVYVTVTVTNPGGPDGEDGSNVQLQQYLSPGLSIVWANSSAGTSFDTATGLWTIGSLPVNAPAATLTLTLKADPGTDNMPLTATADGSSTLFNYPAGDATNAVPIVPISHALVFPPQTLAATAVNAAPEWQLTADRGGGGPYAFVVAPGSTLPPGLFLTKTGFLAGVPTTAGNYTFSVTATSASGVSATAPLQLSIASAPIATAGTAYSDTIGFVNPFTVTPGSTLPPGLSINFNGSNDADVLSGTPTTPGFYSFFVRELFLLGYSDIPMTLFVDTPITISPTSLPNAAIGSPYSQTISATGGSGVFVYGLYNGNVPPGLDVTTDGTLSGTIPSTATPGTYTFSVYAYDASGTEGVQQYSLVVEPALVVSPATLPAATVNSPYSATLAAIGGSGSGYTFALTAGTLPAGLTLSPGGVLSGTIPAGTLALDQAITVTVTDANGTAMTQSYTLNVNPAVTITPTDLGDTAAGADFAATIGATGGSGTGYTFALVGGTLPAGLSLAADGTLSGSIDSNATAGYYAFTVTATDSQGATATATCSLFLDAAVTVPTPKLPVATVGVPYSQQLTANGGSGTYSFAVTAGTLPAGLTLSPAGLVSGTIPGTTPAGTYSFTITASDSIGASCTCPVSLTVAAANITWTGAVSTAWSNPANWSSHTVPGAGDNVTIPAIRRCPVLDVAATVNNVILQGGGTLTLAGHALTVDGTVTNKGSIIVQGNETVTLAHGNDITEGTWTYVGDSTGATVTIANFGYFNLTINDSHPHHDTFSTAGALNVAGNLTIACGTFAPTSSVTTCGVTLSGTGVLDAPAVLNDSGNWTVTGGTFNPDGGTVFLTGTGTTQFASGNRAFANLTHSGTGTVGLSGPLTVGGMFTDAAGSGNFRTNGFAVTITGPATLSGGAFTDGAGPVHFNGGLTLAGGSFLGSSGPVTAAGITMTAGTLTAPTSALTDSRDWSVTGGTFNANHGTVILAGTNQHISGNTTFFNLTKTVTAADTLTFQAGSTQTIGGTLTLKGASASKLLALRSSATGSTWSLVPLGATSVSFVDVQDAINHGKKTLIATHAHNSGDDTGWIFP